LHDAGRLDLHHGKQMLLGHLPMCYAQRTNPSHWNLGRDVRFTAADLPALFSSAQLSSGSVACAEHKLDARQDLSCSRVFITRAHGAYIHSSTCVTFRVSCHLLCTCIAMIQSQPRTRMYSLFLGPAVTFTTLRWLLFHQAVLPELPRPLYSLFDTYCSCYKDRLLTSGSSRVTKYISG
jgi:hypothetical protein